MKIITRTDLTAPIKIAMVISRFNDNITQLLYQGALERFQELQDPKDEIMAVWVPGAIEIPLLAQQLARKNYYDAIVCLGAVIRGETTHYDYVCQQVSTGCQHVALEYNIPVIFGVLTTENTAQALDRVGGEHGHKGRDAIDSALEMISVLRQIHATKFNNVIGFKVE